MVGNRWFFVAILAIQILYSLQQDDKKAEVKEGEGDDIVKDSVKVECITEAQAESISEEIAKMLKTATIVDTATTLFASVTSMPTIESCAEELPESADFKSRYGAKVQQFLAKAAEAEQKINDGNDLKEVSDKLSEILRKMWMIIRRNSRQQQKMLNSLDIFAKDSVLQKAAEIELEIKKNGGSWTLKSIREQLTKELSQATDMMNTMGSSINGLLSPVVKDIIDYFTISQMYTSLRGTDLFKKMKKDFTFANAFGYSEVAMSKCIRQVSKLRHATLVVGYDQATEYSTNVNETLQALQEDIESLNEINEKMTCSERYEIAYQAYQSLDSTFLGVQDKTLKLAREYIDAIDDNAISNIMPLITEQALGSALRGLAFMTPVNSPSELKDATKEVLQFGMNVRRVRNVEDAVKIAEKAYPHVETVAFATACYAKTMDAVGKIRQGCKDGEGTFDAVYDGVEKDLKLDRQRCPTVSGLTFPSKTEVKSMVESAASKLGFNKKCTQNKQRDQPSTKFEYYEETGDDEEDGVKEILTPTQRFTVCNLRKKKSQSEIARLIQIDQNKVEAVRCKA